MAECVIHRLGTCGGGRSLGVCRRVSTSFTVRRSSSVSRPFHSARRASSERGSPFFSLVLAPSSDFSRTSVIPFALASSSIFAVRRENLSSTGLPIPATSHPTFLRSIVSPRSAFAPTQATCVERRLKGIRGVPAPIRGTGPLFQRSSSDIIHVALKVKQCACRCGSGMPFTGRAVRCTNSA